MMVPGRPEEEIIRSECDLNAIKKFFPPKDNNEPMNLIKDYFFPPKDNNEPMNLIKDYCDLDTPDVNHHTLLAVEITYCDMLEMGRPFFNTTEGDCLINKGVFPYNPRDCLREVMTKETYSFYRGNNDRIVRGMEQVCEDMNEPKNILRRHPKPDHAKQHGDDRGEHGKKIEEEGSLLDGDGGVQLKPTPKPTPTPDLPIPTKATTTNTGDTSTGATTTDATTTNTSKPPSRPSSSGSPVKSKRKKLGREGGLGKAHSSSSGSPATTTGTITDAATTNTSKPPSSSMGNKTFCRHLMIASTTNTSKPPSSSMGNNTFSEHLMIASTTNTSKPPSRPVSNLATGAPVTVAPVYSGNAPATTTGTITDAATTNANIIIGFCERTMTGFNILIGMSSLWLVQRYAYQG